MFYYSHSNNNNNNNKIPQGETKLAINEKKKEKKLILAYLNTYSHTNHTKTRRHGEPRSQYKVYSIQLPSFSNDMAKESCPLNSH